jgi:DNA-directed RNA polymerase subunit RPC12/RpoP
MQTTAPDQVLLCTQCGGELHPDQGQIFLTCPYCSSTVYLDKARVVFHWYLAPTLDEGQARQALARWMAGNQTVKDLDQKSSLESSHFEYFPLWYFKHRGPDGQEKIILEPAAATAVSELHQAVLPAGDLRKYEPSLETQTHLPSVPLETALKWLGEQHGPDGQVAEQALVHVPIYTFKYTFNGQVYTAIVEGATGGVFANIYPAKQEAPYLMAGAGAGCFFLLLALIPLVGAVISEWSGAGVGFLVCSGVGLIGAPFLFAWAAWVAAKV